MLTNLIYYILFTVGNLLRAANSINLSNSEREINSWGTDLLQSTISRDNCNFSLKTTFFFHSVSIVISWFQKIGGSKYTQFCIMVLPNGSDLDLYSKVTLYPLYTTALWANWCRGLSAPVILSFNLKYRFSKKIGISHALVKG